MLISERNPKDGPRIVPDLAGLAAAVVDHHGVGFLELIQERGAVSGCGVGKVGLRLEQCVP